MSKATRMVPLRYRIGRTDRQLTSERLIPLRYRIPSRPRR